MAADEIPLNEEREWLGAFFFDDYGQRFLGRLKSSPLEGLSLEYTIANTVDGTDEAGKSDVLYGVLDNGRLCTLYGYFSIRYSGLRISETLTRHGEWRVDYVIVGAHLGKDDKFRELNFAFDNIQEFFFPHGHKDYVSYQSEYLYSARLPGATLSIGNAASFNFLPWMLSGLLHCKDDGVIDRLQTTWNEMQESYGNPAVFIKEEISYYFNIKTDAEEEVDYFISSVSRVRGMLSLLMHSPVRCSHMEIIRRDEKERIRRLPILMNYGLNQRTINISSQKKSNFVMPITSKDVNLGHVMARWIPKSTDYESVVVSLLNETGRRNTHELYGDIVLYIAQIEGINDKLEGAYSERYQYPFEQLASRAFLDGLNHLVGEASKQAIGEVLSDVRNDIAHVGRPKKILSKQQPIWLLELALYLQLFVQSYLLYDVGIPLDLVYRYQDEFMPKSRCERSE